MDGCKAYSELRKNVFSAMETGRTELVGDWVSKDVAIRHRTTTYIHGRLISANRRQRINCIPKSQYAAGRRSVQIKAKSGRVSLCCI
jgi:hypothetical protein